MAADKPETKKKAEQVEVKPVAAKPPAPPSAAKTAQQVGMLAGAFVLLANVMFYFLSDLYFADKAKDMLATNRYTPEQILNIRISFAVFTAIIGGSSVLASFKPRYVGHAIAMVMGVAALNAGVLAFGRDLPTVLPVTLIILAGTIFLLGRYSFFHKTRAAWAFLIAICGVFGGVMLFGAPKVRGILGINLWMALIIPGLLAVATIALSMARDDYAEA
jgi:hypothetical protein